MNAVFNKSKSGLMKQELLEQLNIKDIPGQSVKVNEHGI